MWVYILQVSPFFHRFFYILYAGDYTLCIIIVYAQGIQESVGGKSAREVAEYCVARSGVHRSRLHHHLVSFLCARSTPRSPLPSGTLPCPSWYARHYAIILRHALPFALWPLFAPLVSIALTLEQCKLNFSSQFLKLSFQVN